jgi:deazaflavin-dependent oxidoreductase (nitroreductase family)
MNDSTAVDTIARTTPAAAATSAAADIPMAIRVLRRLEPVVLALLGSPLHRLLSRDVLVLDYRGRRSGRRYRLPLSYVGDGDRLYLCTRPEGSRWWRNLRGGADVEILVRGRRRPARARVLEADSAEAIQALRRFLARNPQTARTLYNVPRGRDGGPSAEHLSREVLGSVVVRLELGAGACDGSDQKHK